ncbi:hypothetical protein LOTGIDRAFT_238908 [Lottia gigantea]|uniref:SANT domain-containing protein n=1 Tax=Lottia gigantea TaxID=225164 RepID=V4APH2_LOTGI|nr:hypothetical protein LOTGIDRAFT_238908 [Lottia gigantea]ESO99097.1 hypothetical protein LOTGIDRAFT_238908 [Lottia gigantea]
MPLAKRRKVVNEESVAKDAPGNRVPGSIENEEKEQGATDDAKTVAPSATSSSSICMTVERRSRHISRSESEDQSIVVTEGDKKIPTPSTPTAAVPLRTSSRVIRKTRKDYSPPESPVKKQSVATAKEPKATTPSTKTKRAWELWSIEDKNVFFEALFEYGKDFDAIQNMLVQRGKRRGLPPELLKRKDQVRFLYYRTWHKITKFVTITKDIRKEAQEIYGLINYGVFRKSIKGLNERTAVKLNDLINKGYTTYKVKGKKKKIKTPVCSALKKINGLVDNKDSQTHQLPERINVEICPRNNKSWSRVQAMSHNPRVKMSLMSDRTLGAILEYLNKKWKSHRERSVSFCTNY